MSRGEPYSHSSAVVGVRPLRPIRTSGRPLRGQSWRPEVLGLESLPVQGLFGCHPQVRGDGDPRGGWHPVWRK